MKITKKIPEPLGGGEVLLPPVGGCYVYRAYCRCGDLLYVGVTESLLSRFAGHRQHSRWEPRMARLEYDLYGSRGDAERVERHLIRTLAPLHNVAGRWPAHRWRRLPWPTVVPEEQRHAEAIVAFRAAELGERIA